MKNVQNSQLFTESLLQRIINDILPFYDLWSLRSFENKRYEYISGNCSEIEKFSQFITEFSSKDYPPDLLLIIGNCEKKYPTVMLNTSKKHMLITFDNSPDYLGEPLIFPSY